MDMVFTGLAGLAGACIVAGGQPYYLVDHLELRSPSLPLSTQPDR